MNFDKGTFQDPVHVGWGNILVISVHGKWLHLM